MLTINDVVAFTRRGGRVCPKPDKWRQLYDMLHVRHQKGMGREVPLPLILAAWEQPALNKMMRLREHIQWAADHNCLAEVCDFLTALQESDWHHLNESTK